MNYSEMSTEDLLALRSELKEKVAGHNAAQLAYKVMMNSLYGALSNVWFRYFDMRMASGITAGGRVSVRGSAKYLEDNLDGMQNLYTDTDSIFLNVDPYVQSRFKEYPEVTRLRDFGMKLSQAVIEPKLEEYFEKLGTALNLKQRTLSMEYECLSDVSVFLEKKKYAMKLIDLEGEDFTDKVKLKIKGIEVVRTSTPQFVRDKLKESLELIFKTADRDKVAEFVDQCKKEFMTLPFEEIAFPRSVSTFTKYIGATKGIPIQVRAAMLYNNFIEHNKLSKYRTIFEGDKIKFAYIKEPNAFSSNAIGCLDVYPEELEQTLQIDWDTQWQKAFEAPMEKIFTACGWDLKETSISLDSWFD